MGNWLFGIKLDLGAGPFVTDGYRGVDIAEFDGVDYVWDLARVPYPAEDKSIDRIICKHTLEHFEYTDVVKIMNECHRILQDHHEMEIIVPMFPSDGAVDDPTHKTFFSKEAFGRFEPENKFAYELDIVNRWRRKLNDWTPAVIPTETHDGLQLLFPDRRELHVILEKLPNAD